MCPPRLQQLGVQTGCTLLTQAQTKIVAAQWTVIPLPLQARGFYCETRPPCTVCQYLGQWLFILLHICEINYRPCIYRFFFFDYSRLLSRPFIKHSGKTSDITKYLFTLSRCFFSLDRNLCKSSFQERLYQLERNLLERVLSFDALHENFKIERKRATWACGPQILWRINHITMSKIEI